MLVKSVPFRKLKNKSEKYLGVLDGATPITIDDVRIKADETVVFFQYEWTPAGVISYTLVDWQVEISSSLPEIAFPVKILLFF